MARIDELLKRVDDIELRQRLADEIAFLRNKKQFGLVFEDHLPESTILYNVPITPGSLVVKDTDSGNNIDYENLYRVIKNEGLYSYCSKLSDNSVIQKVKSKNLLKVEELGKPIFPSLQYVDSVENNPCDSLWHTLIEAENYHALQLLEYLYAEKVDCIYIDPPYNTGDKKWKYNNAFVDNQDAYFHSKWLSFMKRRLVVAKRLLNPETGVLIVTIDEHEVHRLRAIIDDIFRGCTIQMATIVINEKGVSQGRLARVEEYAIYVFMKDALIDTSPDDLLSKEPIPDVTATPRWERLLRGGNNARREDAKTMFYPVYVDPVNKKITGHGPIMPYEKTPDITHLDDQTVAWPIRKDGSWGNYQLKPETFEKLLDLGYIKLGTWDKKRKTWTILYLNRGTVKRINDGDIIITGRDAVTGTVSIEFARKEAKMYNVKTVWHKKLHDSGVYGSTLLADIIGRGVKFDFPKSVYSTKDAIANVVRNNPNALIVDFFAGSGTTLNAVNLLNAEDNGKRRCIIVTNNEVSEDDENQLKAEGLSPVDEKWQRCGICRSVTWPRTKYSVLGKRDDGTTLIGDYYLSKMVKVPVKIEFHQITGISPEMIKTKSQKREIVSLFGKKRMAQSLVKDDSLFLVSDKYPVSILFDTSASDEWLSEIEGLTNIKEVFIVCPDKSKFEDIKEQAEIIFASLLTESPVKIPRSNGFAANVNYFRLRYLDRNSVSLGMQFEAILPLLWMKSGSIGKCPIINGGVPDMMILPENHFAVLNNENQFSDFRTAIRKSNDIETVYFVTNSISGFQIMSEEIGISNCYQLYKNYIDNFVLRIQE